MIICHECKEKEAINSTMCPECRKAHRQAIKKMDADRGKTGSRLWCKIPRIDDE